MSLIDFIRRFPDEEAYKHEFKMRDQQDVICRKCGHTDHKKKTAGHETTF